jgi:hypothetical protein
MTGVSFLGEVVEVGIAGAPEFPEVGIGWCGAEEGIMG